MPRDTRRVYTASTTTRILASFHTDEKDGLNIDEPVRSHPRLGKIIAFSSNKTFGGASGPWTLTIKKSKQTADSHLRAGPRGLWRDPEDVWVRIKVSVDGQIIDTVLGLIDTVGEDTGRSGAGERSETYTINGRDTGKVFEATELFVNFFHDPSRPLRSLGAIVATFTDQLVGTPAHFVRVLVEVWLGNDGTAETPWVLPAGLGGGPFFSPGLPGGGARLSLEGPHGTGIQAMESSVNGEAIAPTLMQIDQGGGHLWDTMQEYANGLMNELFIDLAPAPGQPRDSFENLVPTLTLRERPFPTRSDDGRSNSHSKWDRITLHTLERVDIQKRKIVKGGSGNRHNYWKIRLNGIGTEGFNVDEILQRGVDGVESGKPGNIPIFNPESIARHGVRVYTATTRFVPFFYRSRADTSDGEAVRVEEERQGSFFRLVAAWLKKLHDWFVVAPFELSGTLITTRIQPEIRIGHRVRERRAEGDIIYYVEGVAHSWSYGGGGKTTLTVTRGEYEDDDLLDFIYGQYENPRALTAEEACFVAPLGNEANEADAAATTELLERLAAGCRFVAPTAGDALLDTEAGLTEEFTVASADPSTQLEVERDGTQARPRDDGSVIGGDVTLDDSIPEVGDETAIPPVDAPADPDDLPGQLERQEPLELLEGLDDVGSIGTDPLGGL